MQKWRLSRLKISGFKVFKDYEHEYEYDLVIYDGPNGFGKTSLFDAKQLLFTGELPRIKAKADAIKIGTAKSSQSLFQHHSHNGDVWIMAEFKANNMSLFVIRKADLKQLRQPRRPIDLSHFNLFELSSFDPNSSPQLIKNEELFWTKYFGDNFLKNFSVLHYLPQDHKSLLLPDSNVDGKNRINQIDHLINLDTLKVRQQHISELLKENKNQQDLVRSNMTQIEGELSALPSVKSDLKDMPTYKRLTNIEQIPLWDSNTPFTHVNVEALHNFLSQIEMLRQLTTYPDEVAKRVKNARTRAFLQQKEFELAIRLGSHLDKLGQLKDASQKLSECKQSKEIADKGAADITDKQIPMLLWVIPDRADKLTSLFEARSRLRTEQNTTGKMITDLISARDKLFDLMRENESGCPFCGFEYLEKDALLNAIKDKTVTLTEKLTTQSEKLSQCYQSINEILRDITAKLDKKITELSQICNDTLLSELQLHVESFERLEKIVGRLNELGISLPITYAIENEQKNQQVQLVRDAVLNTLQLESEQLTEESMSFFNSFVKDVESLRSITIQDISDKRLYLEMEFNNLLNKTHQEKQRSLSLLKEKIKVHIELNNELKKIESVYNRAQNDYIKNTIGQIESLFHIYSGRLLQNYQCGLGVFINIPSKGQKNAKMNFVTPRLNQHDAVLSMSSGQSSALSLALFLALHRHYAHSAFLFIDDPTQCMDEINVASLSDLLRVELRGSQVVISTHEQDISDYLTYRYHKAGLTHKTINLLKLAHLSNELNEEYRD